VKTLVVKAVAKSVAQVSGKGIDPACREEDNRPRKA
jgi:hypothetical protein